jgi:hypothetical protein
VGSGVGVAFLVIASIAKGPAMSVRPFGRLLCALLISVPWVADAAPGLTLVTSGPLVGGSGAAEVIVDVSGARGAVRFNTNRGFVAATKFVPPSRYVLTLGLAGLTQPFQLLLGASDATGPSQPVPIEVVAGLYPSIGRMIGSLVAGRQSDLTVEVGQIQRPITVLLDSTDITRDTALEGNLLRIRPGLLAPPPNCNSTLKVVNVSQLWRSVVVHVAWPSPIVSVSDGDVFAGQPSHVVLDVDNLTPGSVVFFEPESGGRRIAPKASVLAGTSRLAIDFALPAVAESYRGRIGVRNSCGAEHSVPVQVKVPQNVQPTITSIIPGAVAAGKPISLTIAGKDFLPSMQVFASLAGGAFVPIDRPMITDKSALIFITLATIDPKTGATVRVRVVNPGDGNTSTTRDVLLTLPQPALPKSSPVQTPFAFSSISSLAGPQRRC